MAKILAVLLTVLLTDISQGFQIQSKILNGTPSNVGDIPFFVAIFQKDKFICSASLLSDTWIITAGHCLEAVAPPRSGDPLFVLLGARSNGTYELAIEVNSTDLFIHPNFTSIRHYHDIGLIKLPHSIQLSQTIQPTKLPPNCDAIDMDEDVYGIGAGITKLHSPRLQRSDGIVRQTIFKTFRCESHPTARKNGYLDSSSVICAYGTQQETVLFADSGGPMTRKVDGIQFGIIRGFMFDMNERMFLQIYTKISYFFDWISEVTGLELPKC